METIKNFFSSAGQLVVDLFSAIGGFFKNVFSGSSAASAPAGGATSPTAPAAPQEPAAAIALKALVSDADRATIKLALENTTHRYRMEDKDKLPDGYKYLASTDNSYHPEIGSTVSMQPLAGKLVSRDPVPIFTQNENGRLVVNMPQNARMEITKLPMSVAMPGQDIQYNVLVAPSYGEIGAAQNPVNPKPTSFTAQSITVTGKMLEQAQMIINTPKIGENSIYAKRDDLAKNTTLVIKSEGAKVGVSGAGYLLNGVMNEDPALKPKPVLEVQKSAVVFVQMQDQGDAQKNHRETARNRRVHSSWTAPTSPYPLRTGGGRTPILNSRYYSRHPNSLYPRSYGY